MKARCVLACAIFVLATKSSGQSAPTAADASAPTYAEDIAPILQKKCQVCHRPGEAGPFPLMTYEQARPWAMAMKIAVQARKMPPWFADPQYGKFSNANGLDADEIELLAKWADAGAPKGDPKDMPPPMDWVEGWGIGKPDKIYELPQPFDVPASGVVDYQHVIVPTGFKEDTWVQAAEVRPTDRMVVHHIIAFVREPDSKWFRGQKQGVFFTAPQVKTKEEPDTSALPSDFLVGYAPGQPPEILRPGQAKLIKAGSDIIFQVHYTPHGHATKDQSRLGIVFAKEPPRERVLTLSATNGTFKIPPGDPNYRVDSSFEVGADVKLSGLHPHMHGRGKDFLYRVVYPSGESKILLSVPHYDWHWQNWYTLEEPIDLPKGSKIDCTAHFDNSPNNPENADPTKEVTWGEQSWDEMMVGFFNLVFDAKMPVQNLFADKKKNKADIASK
ncbi:MAG TPA: cytochrome c [Candidatus Acidoferrum sp.]|nr:cytochrome c [Candidatus Acidoferrum sp.]